MKTTTLILDDDPEARRRLRTQLEREPDLEVLAGPVNGEPPAKLLRRVNPDLILTETQVGGTDGFELLRSLEADRFPAVIFVTAQPEHALTAYEANALDYLVKPVRRDRLRQALDRARQYLRFRANGHSRSSPADRGPDSEAAPRYLTRVTIKEADRMLFVRAEHITWVEAAENYLILHLGKQSHILRENLGTFEASVDPGRFFRISRSALVNINHITELRPWFKGEYVVVLTDGSRLTMTRDVRALQELLQFA